MKIYDFTIKSPRGLHAQPCAALAAIALTSSASLGEHIIIKVSGNDEEDILLKLKEIIDSQL